MTKRFLTLTLVLFLLAACAPAPALPDLLPTPTPDANDIVLNGGTYTDYVLAKSGTESDPIIVHGNGSTLRCVLITGSYIVWRDTIITGCPSFGIRVKGAHVVVEYNTITNVVLSNWDGAKCVGDPRTWDSAVRAADTTDVIFRFNLIYKVCGEGLSVLRSSYVTIEGNTIYDAFSVNIYVDQASFTTVKGNWSYSTGDTRYYKAGQVARGLSIGAEIYSGWAFNVHDLLIANNTFERVRGINYIVEQAGTPYNVTVRDNQFISVVQPYVALPSWATVSNNVAVTATPGGTAVTPTPSRTPAPPTATATSTVTTVTPTPSATSTPTPTGTAVIGTATPECIYFPAHDEEVCLK